MTGYVSNTSDHLLIVTMLLPLLQLMSELGSDVSESLVRTTATNMMIQEQVEPLSDLFYNDQVSINDHCNHIATDLLQDESNMCDIIRTVSPYCAYTVC